MFWANRIIPRASYTEFTAALARDTYAATPPVWVLETAERLGIPSTSALMIRSAVRKNKIIAAYPQMRRRLNEAKRVYKTLGIMAAARDLDVSPWALLREILGKQLKTARGWDKEQRDIAAAYDPENSETQTQHGKNAYINECLFVEYIRGLGFGLKTQEDLVAEGCPITPDILFDAPVTINDHSVRWIDFKDYVGTDIPFLLKSNRDQAAKYAARWGQGALAYRGSFVEGLEIEGCILLDAGSLPIEFNNLL